MFIINYEAATRAYRQTDRRPRGGAGRHRHCYSDKKRAEPGQQRSRPRPATVQIPLSLRIALGNGDVVVVVGHKVYGKRPIVPPSFAKRESLF